MLIFWNLAGVPLSYCHCTLYLANHLDDIHSYPFRTPLLVLLFTSYLFIQNLIIMTPTQLKMKFYNYGLA